MDRIYEWAKLSNPELARLDRLRTVVLLPLGHTQQFGPHLPHGTTSYAVQAIIQETAELLTMTDRSLSVVCLPLLAYGADPAEMLHGSRFTQSSSLSLQPETLAYVISDIVEGVVRNGFRYLFTIGHHAGRDHCRAVQKAMDRHRRQYPALITLDTFSYLYAGAAANAAPDLSTLTKRRVSPIEQAAIDTPGHGGTADTAIMLALEPGLVATGYAGMEGLPVDNVPAMDDWSGYYGGAPSLAEADLGRAVISQQAYRVTSLIRKAIAGESLADLPRYPEY